jgi:hypothetical protein
LTQRELERELRRLRAELDKTDIVQTALLARRNKVMKVLADRDEVRLSTLAEMAGVTASAVAFATGKYVRAGRKGAESGQP